MTEVVKEIATLYESNHSLTILNFNSMKLTEIKDIKTLNVEQAQTVKGGARDTRGGQTTATSSYTIPLR